MRWHDLKYFLAYVGPCSAYLGIYLAGIWSFLAVAIGFILIPLLEWIIPVNEYQDDDLTDLGRKTHWYFDALLYVNVPIVYGLVLIFLWRISSSDLHFIEVTGMVLGVALYVSTCGVNVAHELGHRPGVFNRLTAQFLLLAALYQHYYIEHNRGHHKWVGTTHDPATARYGENLYLFWLRASIGEIISAWNLERQRLMQKGYRYWSFHNLMIRFGVVQLIFLITIVLIFGWSTMLVYLISCIIASFIVQTTNYIEHYGLIRKINERGNYERVQMKHAWNSNHLIGRIFLYELTRHSDHHYKASKKYQMLKHVPESPQLPTGYPGSMLLATVPPLWFEVMNKRIPKDMVPDLML